MGSCHWYAGTNGFILGFLEIRVGWERSLSVSHLTLAVLQHMEVRAEAVGYVREDESTC